MLEVGGLPVLEHILFWLSKHGISDVMVNTGYKGEVIHNYLGTRCAYFYDPQLTFDVEQTITQVSSWFLGEPVLVQNGDTMTNLNIGELYLMSSGKSVRFMDIEKPTIFAGTKILSPNYLVGIERKIFDVSVDTQWVDIGTPEGLDTAQKLYGQRTMDN